MNGHNGYPGNSADSDGASGSARDYDRGRSGTSSRRRISATGAPMPAAPATADKPSFSVDMGSVLRPASKRWYWLLLGGLIGAIGGAILGLSLWTIGYSASAQLVRYEAPITGDAYRPQPIRGETLLEMSKSPEVMRRVAEKLKVSVGTLGSVNAIFGRQSDIVNVHATGADPRSAVELANAFNAAFIEWTQDSQRQEAIAAEKYNAQFIKDNDADLAAARKLLPTGALSAGIVSNTEGGLPVTISPRKAEQIQKAEDELNDELVKYTDQHPRVKAARMKLAQLKAGLPPDWSLEKALASARAKSGDSANGAASIAGGASREEQEIAFRNVAVFEQLKNQLTARQRAIELFKANPPGNFRELQPASMDTVRVHKPWIKVGLVAAFCGMLGFVLAGAEVLRREIFDNRLKTEADVARVTGLPVLATLGDIRQMSLADRESWAFRTWIALQDRLAYSPNHGLICGFTSSNPSDGRSTWISLLAGAARKCGFRVLTIATRPTAEAPAMTEEQVDSVPEPVVVGAEEPVGAHANGSNGHAYNGANGNHRGTTVEPGNGRTTAILSSPSEFANASRAFNGDSEFTALTASALFTPAMVTEKLMGPETDPLVHIPLPGWTWNLERRKQWQGALNVWRKIDNVVILVELPPASMPESVLLASNLPNLVWLAESGKSDAAATRSQLETLRHARCNLVGAVINRALTSVTQGRFSRWVSCFATIALLGLFAGQNLSAGEPPRAVQSPQVSAEAANTAFSVVSPAQRAQWQQKLTLGPGDVLSFSLYGDPEALREEVPIGPDGRVSYLEAQNVMAAGLTVDEFRERLNEELGKYRRAAQAFVVPVAYKSKKYYVLGKVTQRGAFPLDRPTTLVEAVARAGGMETGMASDRSLVELADLSRSFIARGGRRLPVDFEKLFQHGDLSQNVQLEPDDYIYFPAGGEREVFVLGAVRVPGAHVYTGSVGVVGAISGRGGFNERAWQKKLLVIRGGLGRPQTFEIDAFDVLSGKKPDIALQPRDIVFVADRPWIYAEELLDAAANAFVTSAVVTWTGEKVTRDN